MKIATWNVNSIKARLDHVMDWLQRDAPEIVCLQEIKCVDENFPAEHFEGLGYNVAVHGQKAYNGVAILSKLPFDDVVSGLAGDAGDDQARYLEAVVSSDGGAVRVACLYLPNGNPPQSEKYPYKLAWMDRLIARAKEVLAFEEIAVFAGDFNVIPGDDDVYDPAAWAGDALCLPATRERFRTLLNLGLSDAFSATHTQRHHYTFWDYQAGAWQKDHGIRIDHLLLSPQAADRLTGCRIDRFTRGWERPSDHVPVWIELDLPLRTG